MRHEGSGKIYAAAVPDDVRRWQAGQTQSLTWTIGVHPQMPAGKYALLLHLPDGDAGLASRLEYAIRLANKDVWEATTGYNSLLHTVTVNASAPPAPYSGTLYFTGSGLQRVESERLYLPQVQG